MKDKLYLPDGWRDRPEDAKGINEWLDTLYGVKIDSDGYRGLTEEEAEKRIDNGSINFYLGFIISPETKTREKTDEYDIHGNWIDCDDPLNRITEDVNILPLMEESRKTKKLIPLSGVVDTNSRILIHPEGIIIPNGSQINSYVIEYAEYPKGYIYQATTPSSIGRKGLDSVSTAGTINGDWKGILLCELRNYGDEPVLAKVGSRIVQAYPVPNAESVEYKGQFQEQKH